MRLLTYGFFAFATVGLTVGCGDRGGGQLPLVGGAAHLSAGAGSSPVRRMDRNPFHKIKHIVIIIQENRSLENLFYGYPNAKTVKFGRIHTGKRVQIMTVKLAEHWDFVHSSSTFFTDCNGTGQIPGTDCRMNGFDRVRLNCFVPPCHPRQYPAYSYVAQNEIQPYFDMAQQYVLTAQMFA